MAPLKTGTLWNGNKATIFRGIAQPTKRLHEERAALGGLVGEAEEGIQIDFGNLWLEVEGDGILVNTGGKTECS